MATSIIINGRRENKPGTYVKLDASAAAQQGPGAVGVVALIGTAEGGKPLDVAADVADSTTPDGIAARFRGGDLRHGGRFAFEPSDDDNVPGGAQVVVAVKVNPATQSTALMYDEEGFPVATANSADYGAFTERVSVDVENGTTQGKRLVYKLDASEEQFDDAGGDPFLSAMISALTNWGSTALWAKRFSYDTRYRAERDDTITPNRVLADAAVTLQSTAAGDTQSVTVHGINAAGAVASVTTTMNGTTPVVTAASFVSITAIVLALPAYGYVTGLMTGGQALAVQAGQRQAGRVTATSPNITARPVQVWASTDDPLVPHATGRVVVTGLNSVGVSTTEIVTLGAEPVTLSTNYRSISAVDCGNASRGTVFVRQLDSRTDIHAGEHKSVTTVDLGVAPMAGAAVLTFTPAGSVTKSFVVTGLNAAGAVVSETVALSSAAAVPTSASFRVILGISGVGSGATAEDIVLTGPATGTIPAGTITGFGAANYSALTMCPVGTDIYVTVRGATERACVIAIQGEDASGTIETRQFDVEGNTTFWVSNTWRAVRSILASQLSEGATVEVFAGFQSVNGSTYDTIRKAVDRLNTNSRITASVTDTRFADIAVAELDAGPWVGGANTAAAELLADLYRQILATNSASRHVRLTRSNFAGAPLGNIAAPRYLAGGIEGVTTITEWQEAFRLLRKRDVNTIVALSNDPAVHSLLLSHLRDRATTLAMEANGYVGLGTVIGAGDTRANIKSRIVALQGRHCSFVSQELARTNLDTGLVQWWPPYMLAVVCAGAQAATPIAEPTTGKRIIASDIRNDASWRAEEDGNAMIDMGLMFFENKDGTGIVCVRSITGHLADNNPVFVEMGANESLNTSVRRLRRVMNTKVGKRGLANSVPAMKSIATGELNNQRDEPIILDWRPNSLVIERIADVFPMSVDILPMLGINFIPITVHVSVT